MEKEWRRPIQEITEDPLVTARINQVEECMRKCDEAREELDKLRNKARSGDIRAAKQLEIDEPRLKERIREYTTRASRLIEAPLS